LADSQKRRPTVNRRRGAARPADVCSLSIVSRHYVHEKSSRLQLR
jgi:hypothetical protein